MNDDKPDFLECVLGVMGFILIVEIIGALLGALPFTAFLVTVLIMVVSSTCCALLYGAWKLLLLTLGLK